jgi:hypothetical protein
MVPIEYMMVRRSQINAPTKHVSGPLFMLGHAANDVLCGTSGNIIKMYSPQGSPQKIIM